MNNVKVDIVDDNKEVVFSCVIHKLTVALDARRLDLTGEILSRDVSDSTKGQLMSCAAFAASFHNEDGELMYPEDDAADVIYNTMDARVYGKLCSAYLEVNPLETTLDAKKKKY